MLLVTGAAGFIGARFVESCNQRKIDVVSVDDKRLFRSRPEHSQIQFGETIDRDAIFEWLQNKNTGVSGFVHLGACTDTTEFDVELLKRVNTEYSQKLWKEACRLNIPFVYASSAATYGDGELGYNDSEETIPKLTPLNPYGQSKQDFDLWVLDAENDKTPPAWSGFKFFNVYGYGERHKTKMSSVVLQAFDQIQASGKMKLFKSHNPAYKDGEQKRDFIFIDDVVKVLHFALSKPIKRGIFNLGSGRAQTFLELVHPVFEGLEKKIDIEFIDTPIEIRDKYQYFTEASMEKLRAEGYSNSFTPVEEGVRKYVRALLGQGS